MYIYPRFIYYLYDEKGKPFVRMGPRLRQSALAFDYAGSGVVKHDKYLTKTEQNYRALYPTWYRVASCHQEKKIKMTKALFHECMWNRAFLGQKFNKTINRREG